MAITPVEHSGPSRLWRAVAVVGAIVAGGVAFATSVPTAGALPPPVGATVVGIAGPDCPSPSPLSIQEVIDDAAPGATIFICAGTYGEQLTINKPLTLLGAQWGVDARSGRTNSAAETVFNVPAGAFVYTAGATTGTLDGFTMTGATGTAVSGIANNAAAYTFENNIITANATGLNFHTVGPGATMIRHNRFVANTGPNASDGSSIFVTNGFVAGMTVEENLFQGNVGPNAADINTPGAATPSTGIVIRNNTSDADQTFAVINNTSGTQILDNTIVKPDTVPAGSAILLFSANPGTVISGNTITGGNGTGIGDNAGSVPTGPVTVDGNTITGRTVGIRFSQDGATVTGNTVTNTATTGAAGTGVGIFMQDSSSGGTVSGNSVSGSAVLDCQDDSVGGGTAGTANTWTANIGATSSPTGLCQLPPPTTTTTTTTTAASTTTTSPGTTTTSTIVAGATTSMPSVVPGRGTLPATGGDSSMTLAWLALALVAVGAALTRVHRRE